MDMLLKFGIGADSSTFELPHFKVPRFENWAFQNGGYQNGEIENGACREPWPFLRKKKQKLLFRLIIINVVDSCELFTHNRISTTYYLLYPL